MMIGEVYGSESRALKYRAIEKYKSVTGYVKPLGNYYKVT